MLIDATTDQRLAKQSNDFRTLVDSVKQDTSIRLQNIRAEAKAERDTIKAELVQDANSAAQVAAENAVELVLAKGLADQVWRNATFDIVSSFTRVVSPRLFIRFGLWVFISFIAGW